MTQRFFEYLTIYGADGEHDTPYMTRIVAGRLRLHIFYRGDADPDPHDHPWGFYTFPLVSYVEEVFQPGLNALSSDDGVHWRRNPKASERIVRAFRIHYRPATFAHRVLHSYWLRTPNGRRRYTPFNEGARKAWSRPIITIVWTEKQSRRWGFWKTRDGVTCWQHWKEYIFNGGKNAPCQ